MPAEVAGVRIYRGEGSKSIYGLFSLALMGGQVQIQLLQSQHENSAAFPSSAPQRAAGVTRHPFWG